MLALVLKRCVLVAAIVGTVLVIGCGKDKKDQPQELNSQAQSAYNSCVTRLRPMGREYNCGEVRPYYNNSVCSLNQYLSGYFCYSQNYSPPQQQQQYGPYQPTSYFRDYLRYFPAQDLNEMIYYYNQIY
jgi:hypothetical protein